MGVSGVIPESFKGVKGKGVFQGCYMGVSRVLVDCHNGVTWAF